MIISLTQSARPLSFKDVRITKNGQPLIALNAEIKPGEGLTVMGPSGAGKSTLLAYAAGFLDPEFRAGGSVFSGDEDLTRLPPEKRQLGLLFQDPLLFPHLSVLGNLMFAIPPTVRKTKRRRELALAALADVEMEEYGERDPATLSGGQKARVALMRVLLSAPRALLLDEPFSKLDQHLRSQTRQLVYAQARALQLPILLVTHDRADAQTLEGPIIELSS